MRIANPERRRLAVLGSPIAHSKSPAIHAAAYRELGLDWEYGRAEVREGELAAFVASLGPEWRGLSLTMPLKREAMTLDAVPDRAGLTTELGQANTVVLHEPRPLLHTTDAYGIREALRGAGAARPRTATVLGGGATAESAVHALAELGAEVTIAARAPERIRIPAHTVVTLTEAPMEADVVVSTVPGGAVLPVSIPTRVEGVLLDVVYEPWPTPLAASWAAAGGRLLSGLELLIQQAMAQIRIFATNDPDTRFRTEGAAFAAMRAAAGLPAAVEGS